jgi:serine/threonine-protein kinase
MDDTCSSGGTYHATFTATMALPQPLQDPITSLVGHGYANVPAGVSCPSQAYDETYTRTGD